VTPAIERRHLEAAAPASATITHYATSEEFYKELGSKGNAFDWIKMQLAPSVPLRPGSDATLIDRGNTITGGIVETTKR
jgi:hypothetical protein